MKGKKLKVFFSQLSLLLWKIFTIQKRSILGTILELIVPVLFTIALLPIRSLIKSEHHSNTTTYKPFDLKNFGDSFVQYTNSTFAYYPNTSLFANKLINKVSDDLRFPFKCKLFY